MKPTIAILVIAFLVVAAMGAGYAGVFEMRHLVKTADKKPAYSEHCIGRVTYIQFDNAVVTKLKPDGRVWTCGGV